MRLVKVRVVERARNEPHTLSTSGCVRLSLRAACLVLCVIENVLLHCRVVFAFELPTPQRALANHPTYSLLGFSAALAPSIPTHGEWNALESDTLR